MQSRSLLFGLACALASVACGRARPADHLALGPLPEPPLGAAPEPAGVLGEHTPIELAAPTAATVEPPRPCRCLREPLPPLDDDGF